MKQITAPFPLFVDRAGDPLDAGYVYIGAVNQNPETSPIAVYWDEAGTQPAAQPLRTSSGMIVNGVTPARVFISATDYSILIKDKNNARISSILSTESLEAELLADGASMIGFKPNYVSASTILLSKKLEDWESLSSFYPEGNDTDDGQAFANAWNALATNKRTLYVPFKTGGYSLASGFDIPPGCGLIFAPATLLTFTGNVSYGIRVRKGCQVVGNGAKLKFTHSLWNGFGLYLSGADIFADDVPTSVDGFNIEGNDITKGTAVGLEATDAGQFITFVRMSNITAYTMNYLLTLNVGSSGSADSTPTWHWINGNTFANFTGYSLSRGVSMVGTRGVPAECNGNILRDFQLSVNGTPIYLFGASGNFINAQVFDWNYASGDAVIMEGGAVDNRIVSNIRVEGITGYATNFCDTQLGELTGPRRLVGDVDVTGYVNATKEVVAGTRVWVKDTSAVEIGYTGQQARITGDTSLVLTPRTGYNTRIASLLDVSGNVKPFADNVHSCGEALFRWSVVYAATGTINTSDQRAKQDIQDVDAAVLRAWGKVKYQQYKFRDAVALKSDGARLHIGLIAQQVKEAFESEGLNAFEYGLLCYDEWGDSFENIEEPEEYIENGITKTRPKIVGQRKVRSAGNRYGIRYEEALALECAYLRSQLDALQ